MRILVADDHTLVREMLVEKLGSMADIADEIEIIEAGNFGEVRAHVDKPKLPDIILLDLHMPGATGIDGVRQLVGLFPNTRILVISGQSDPSTARRCIAVGAAGFIPKTISSKALYNAIRVVRDGEIYVHQLALYELPDEESSSEEEFGLPKTGSTAAAFPKLSERESQILGQLLKGLTNKQISRAINLQEMTVKTHLRNIYRKLGAQNRADAVAKVLNSQKHR